MAQGHHQRDSKNEEVLVFGEWTFLISQSLPRLLMGFNASQIAPISMPLFMPIPIVTPGDGSIIEARSFGRLF